MTAAHESLHLDLLGIARQLHTDAPDLGAICDGLAEAVAHRYGLFAYDGVPPLGLDWPQPPTLVSSADLDAADHHGRTP